MEWDYIIVGSGFGGSVSALRLSEKGYRVAVLEKGRRLEADDFPKTNWNLRRWLWMPRLGFRGLFKMTFLGHVTALSGVGVGGGSLVYANTLPIPKAGFFQSPSWSHLGDWQSELEPHYRTARRMLGASKNPYTTPADDVIRNIGKSMGREDHFESTTLAVHFGQPGKRVPDPYFGGEGPDRVGCIQCGGCMLGCRYGSKNTLDKNYLWLAEKRGAEIFADTEVTFIEPLDGGGFAVTAKVGTGMMNAFRKTKVYRAKNVILSGGVLGSVNLLLKMAKQRRGLPELSSRLGDFVRTNSESLLAVTANKPEHDMSKGVAIGSILHTDDHSHLEPVRYSAGSGFLRFLGAPHGAGHNALARIGAATKLAASQPRRLLRSYFGGDWARDTMILLYMRSLDGYLRLNRGRSWRTGGLAGLVSKRGKGPAPSAYIPEATELALQVGEQLDGVPTNMITETLLGIPTTAHILGGATMGKDPTEGVIDRQHRVFGYDGLYVIDGAAVSANPGVNPSLTITALAERAMTFIEPKKT